VIGVSESHVVGQLRERHVITEQSTRRLIEPQPFDVLHRRDPHHGDKVAMQRRPREVTSLGQRLDVECFRQMRPDMPQERGKSLRAFQPFGRAVTAQMTAYRYSQTVTGLGIEHGNLLANCRQTLTPYPVTDVIAGPHSDSGWLVIVALSFAEPGRYRIDRVRIDYTMNGQRGWQYQNLNTTIVVSAARKGTRPRFDGCP
jgi:hypothetical protein